MRAIRRLLLDICKFAVLTCIGVPVYFYVRHVPRSTVDGFVSLGGLSADGRTLLVSDFSVGWLKENRADGEEPEKVKLYDTHSGRVVQSFDQVTTYSLSPDGRQAALQVGRDVAVVDLATSSHWTLPSSKGPIFSPVGKW